MAKHSAAVRISKEVYAAERKALRAYAQRSGLRFKATGFDLWYAVVDSAKDRCGKRFPRAGETVGVDCDIRNLKGEIIYGTDQNRSRQIKLDGQGFIYGLNEGIKLLKVGDSAIFLIPSHMAFGFRGDGDRIAPNTPLVVHLKLKQISNSP
ncbi:MAG: FKBP-type peptidyl-prolyl cis-trans isomerase [Flavobacteriales bacterium]